jgi:hypothetical protein
VPERIMPPASAQASLHSLFISQQNIKSILTLNCNGDSHSSTVHRVLVVHMTIQVTGATGTKADRQVSDKCLEWRARRHSTDTSV